EDGIRDGHVTGVQTCALPIFRRGDGDAAYLQSSNRVDVSPGVQISGVAVASSNGGEHFAVLGQGLAGTVWGLENLAVLADGVARSEERRVGEGGGWSRDGGEW